MLSTSKIKNTINISNNNANILKPITVHDNPLAVFTLEGTIKPFNSAKILALLAYTSDTIARTKLPKPNKPDNGSNAMSESKPPSMNEPIEI
jgi:hypothetical protein